MAGWSSFEVVLDRLVGDWTFGTDIYLNGRLRLGTSFRRGMSWDWVALREDLRGRIYTLELFEAELSSIRCRG